MSSRYIEPTKIFPTQTVTVAGSPWTSNVLNMKTLPRGAIQIIYGAGLTATFSIQGSVDGVTFDDLGIVVAPAAGAPGSALIDLSQYGPAYFQVVTTVTGGPATLTIWANAKSGG